MACSTSRNKKKKYCISSFRHYIRVIDSQISPADESYTVDNTDFVLSGKAIIKTSSGISFSNGVNIDTGITHTFIIRYVNIPIEKNFMIWKDGEFYRIESIENIDEDNQYLKIKASKRGTDDLGANFV
jgi:hypothetical protein